jgi:Tol biopolymer transport system component
MPRLSPDHKSAVVRSSESGTNDIWIHTAGKKTRLTIDEEADRPSWHPTGEFISFTSGRRGNMDVHLQKVDGSVSPQRLVGTAGADFGFDWFPDGNSLMGTIARAGTNGNVYQFRRKASGDWEAVPFVETEFDEYGPMLSPDAKYVAYTSNESGRFEVYIRQFPQGGKLQVSTSGGQQPHWRGDGKELFYVDGDNMMATPVSLSPRFSVGIPTKLFEHRGLSRYRGHQYDVTRDGQRFLLIEVLKEPDRALQVVENWFAEFRNGGVRYAR